MTDSTNGKRQSARGRKPKKREEDVLETEEESDTGDQPAKVSATKRRATRRGGDSDEAPAAKSNIKEEAKTEAKAFDTDSIEKVAPRRQEIELTPAEVIRTGEAWLGELFTKMNLNLSAQGSKDDENYVFTISGSDTEALIGTSRNSPRVLQAVQTIIVEKLGRATRGKVVVDLGGFKEKQQGRLSSVAQQLGETARRIKRPLTVAGLSNFDRRIIHQELEDTKGLSTESTDKGIFRKLRVLPD